MGREWRVHHHDQPQPTQRRQGRRYKEIVSWFVDEAERPYSIHRIAKQGLALDKRIGEWFGPSTVAHALKYVFPFFFFSLGGIVISAFVADGHADVSLFSLPNRRLTKSHYDCPLKVIVPMDGTVRVSAVLRAASSHISTTAASSTSPSPSPDLILRPTPTPLQTQAWRPVLLLIPVRYGLDRVTGKYIANLKQLFRMPQFLGIAGGRPNRSLYFVASQGKLVTCLFFLIQGKWKNESMQLMQIFFSSSTFVGDELFYYDPHFVKQRVTPEELGSCPMPVCILCFFLLCTIGILGVPSSNPTSLSLYLFSYTYKKL